MCYHRVKWKKKVSDNYINENLEMPLYSNAKVLNYLDKIIYCGVVETKHYLGEDSEEHNLL